MTRKTARSPRASAKAAARPFTPVPVRPRHDGWTPERQIAFVEALAESACVAEAARAVGMSVEGAYRLRRHPDSQAFRIAWDHALEYAVSRLSDAAIGRAINGIAIPHYYKGELVGEHRRFDEGLTRFILRYRDPVRYGRAIDREAYERHPDGQALMLDRAVTALSDEANGLLERAWSFEPSKKKTPFEIYEEACAAQGRAP